MATLLIKITFDATISSVIKKGMSMLKSDSLIYCRIVDPSETRETTKLQAPAICVQKYACIAATGEINHTSKTEQRPSSG